MCWINGNLEKLQLKELGDKYRGYFIVNYGNFEVVYTDGYENEYGVWCYRITDLKKKPESNHTRFDRIINNEINQAEQSAGENTEESSEG
jgi:hypothetical protein